MRRVHVLYVSLWRNCHETKKRAKEFVKPLAVLITITTDHHKVGTKIILITVIFNTYFLYEEVTGKKIYAKFLEKTEDQQSFIKQSLQIK